MHPYVEVFGVCGEDEAFGAVDLDCRLEEVGVARNCVMKDKTENE